MKMASRDKRRKRWDQNATAKISFPLHVQSIRLCVSAVILLQGLRIIVLIDVFIQLNLIMTYYGLLILNKSLY